jgi:hypothetical protein
MVTPATKTAEAPRPLDAAERKQLEELLARTTVSQQTPATRFGDPYIALINLSVPRRGDPEKNTDLVMAGEKLNLTPDEAEGYMRHGQKDGRRIAVIRRATGPESTSEPPQRVPPKAVSGPLHAPPPPPKGSDFPRPDPPGSSFIEYRDVPESGEPVPGQENWNGDPGAGGTEVFTEDIIPSRTRARQQAAR